VRRNKNNSEQSVNYGFPRPSPARNSVPAFHGGARAERGKRRAAEAPTDMAQQREPAAAAEFPRRRRREKRGSEPRREQLRIGGFEGIQSGHSWTPSL